MDLYLEIPKLAQLLYVRSPFQGKSNLKSRTTYFAYSTFYTELITIICAYYVVSICFLFLWAENASAKIGQKSLAKILQRTDVSQENHLYVEVY